MEHQLDLSDIATIIESFRYSKHNIDSPNSTLESRKHVLDNIEKVELKLKAIKAELIK